MISPPMPRTPTVATIYQKLFSILSQIGVVISANPHNVPKSELLFLPILHVDDAVAYALHNVFIMRDKQHGQIKFLLQFQQKF